MTEDGVYRCCHKRCSATAPNNRKEAQRVCICNWMGIHIRVRIQPASGEWVRLRVAAESWEIDPVLLILAGQPQLLAKLALRVHLPFRQRVAMRYRMPPMDEQHTRGYVEHHLRLAGRKQRLFTDEALIQLFVQSGGVPRAIGNLALYAMYNAAAQGKDLVELDDVVAASKEVI